MRLLYQRRARSTSARGQALVEFAVVLPIIALLLVMAIDFGRVFFGWVALTNAARIGADFAANRADTWPADQDRYRELVGGDLEAINCTPPAGPLPDPTFPSGTDTGDPAVVELTCTFPLITPLAEGVLGGPVALGARSEFPINKGIQQELPPAVGPDPPPPTDDEDPGPDPDECGAPSASFTVGANPKKGVPVNFTDTSSIGTCTPIAWAWDFDDGSTSSVQSPSHAFTWSGNSNNVRFDVTLTVTTSGGVDSETVQVTVKK